MDISYFVVYGFLPVHTIDHLVAWRFQGILVIIKRGNGIYRVIELFFGAPGGQY